MSDSKDARTSKKAEKEAALAAVHEKRTGQLQSAKQKLSELQSSLKDVSALMRRRAELNSHLDGFYLEIDKLAKGRAMLEVTPLVVEQANSIIDDAKNIVKGDVYLDRIPRFVPAGNNPVYPDVLIAMRGVRQSLDRAVGNLKDRRERIQAALSRAKTIIAALEVFLQNEEDGNPSQQDVEYSLSGAPLAADFFYDADDGEHYFDLDMLDDNGVAKCVLEGVEETDATESDDDGESLDGEEDDESDDLDEDEG